MYLENNRFDGMSASKRTNWLEMIKKTSLSKIEYSGDIFENERREKNVMIFFFFADIGSIRYPSVRKSDNEGILLIFEELFSSRK